MEVECYLFIVTPSKSHLEPIEFTEEFEIEINNGLKSMDKVLQICNTPKDFAFLYQPNLDDFIWRSKHLYEAIQDRDWETNFDFVQPIDDREYKVQVLYAHSGGTATSTSANKLVDSSANFYADASVGDCVYNLTDGGFANVTAIDSGTQISIDSNIFASGEEYLVYKKYWTGFIIQDQYTLPMKAFPFMLEFYASDLLGTIDGYQYEGTTERPSAIEVIKECLKNINEQNGSADVGSALQFDYRTLCRIKPNTSASNGDPFFQTFIRSREAMFDENDIF